MNIDDSQGAAMGNSNHRSVGPQKYPEKGPNYSPSTSYNYGHQNGYSNGAQQSTRRRPEHFKRDSSTSSNSNDRLVKQNDIIIRLLKEIRDRLPNDNTVSTVPGVEGGTDNGIPEKTDA